jgi:hypothetical protein
LNTLAERIAEHLKERGFCLVFEADLDHCWPGDTMDSVEQGRQIRAFAKSHGWTVSVVDIGYGLRALFSHHLVRHLESF